MIEQLLALQHQEKSGQASLAEEHLPHANLAITSDWVREVEVQFDEEKCGQVEVFVSPEPTVVDSPGAVHVVAYVYCEPYFFNGEAHTSRHEVSLIP